MKGKIYTTLSIRILAIIFAAVLVNMCILLSFSTLSAFDSRFTSSGTIDAAKTSELLSALGFEDEAGNRSLYIEGESVTALNPKYIVLQNVDSTLRTIYFEVTGDAAQFFDHLQPITLIDTLGIKEEIRFKISPEQYESLKSMADDTAFSGYVTFKYLSGYITAPIEVKLTKGYIFERVSGSVAIMEAYENKIAALEKKVVELEAIIAEKDVALSELKKAYDSLALQKADLEKQIHKLEIDNQQLAQRLEVAEAEILRLLKEIEKLKNKGVDYTAAPQSSILPGASTELPVAENAENNADSSPGIENPVDPSVEPTTNN